MEGVNINKNEKAEQSKVELLCFFVAGSFFGESIFNKGVFSGGAFCGKAGRKGFAV